MNIKDLFEKAENGMLTFEQFENAAKEAGASFKDVKDGNYVSKSKYDEALRGKDNEITTLSDKLENLNTTIATRDTDLANLKEQLASAGNDASKLEELNTNLSSLQAKYDQDVKDYQAKLDKQAYEFAVKEFANGKKFSSQAAKRDFTQAMIAKGLQLENGKLIGGDDFVSLYSQDNADAFVVEPPKADPPKGDPAPSFVGSTPGDGKTPKVGEFNFDFKKVR